MRARLPDSLGSGDPRVLKQIRGQSGEGVWKVELADPLSRSPSMISSDTALRIQEAERGSAEERMSFGVCSRDSNPISRVPGHR